MARTDELKLRVDRLLAGGLNPRDLDVLFLWLRERSFGNKAVVDVGDFVAHDREARAAIGQILAALRGHGLIEV